MIRINLEGLEKHINIDYIYCLTYRGIDIIPDTQDSRDTSNAFECKLNQPMRCSHEILEFANFYQMHHHNHGKVMIQKQHICKSPFSTGNIPLWIELEKSDQFSTLAQFIDCDEDDVLVLCTDESGHELDKIKHFCMENNWNFEKHAGNVRGAEANVIVLYVGCYCTKNIGYEELTRAKYEIVFVSIHGQKKYTYFYLHKS